MLEKVEEVRQRVGVAAHHQADQDGRRRRRRRRRQTRDAEDGERKRRRLHVARVVRKLLLSRHVDSFGQ